MERIAEKLSEIEKTARAIVDNAQEQKASDGNADAEKEGCI